LARFRTHTFARAACCRLFGPIRRLLHAIFCIFSGAASTPARCDQHAGTSTYSGAISSDAIDSGVGAIDLRRRHLLGHDRLRRRHDRSPAAPSHRTRSTPAPARSTSSAISSGALDSHMSDPSPPCPTVSCSERSCVNVPRVNDGGSRNEEVAKGKVV
jgi:hypothetical protein